MRMAIPATILAVFIFYLIPAMLPVAAINMASNATNNSSASPASIELKAERSHVTADEDDYVTLTAYVYDAQGNPVPDGTQVNFTIGNAVSNPFTGGYTWSIDDGSLTVSPYSNTNYCFTEDGSASARYGWVPAKMGGNNSTIWAYVNGTDIHSTIKIYSAAPSASLIGRVVDTSGAGIGGIPVTLHVMGYNDSQPYEIYNMTRNTSSKPSSVGQFAFDYIVLQGSHTYCYADAGIRLTDNLTIYGKSGNITMNYSTVSIGTIVLNAHSENTIAASPTAASPTATAKPTPGFEFTLVLAGLISAAYLVSRKKN